MSTQSGDTTGAPLAGMIEFPAIETHESKLFFAILAAMIAPVPAEWVFTKFLCGILMTVALFIWNKYMSPKYACVVDAGQSESKEFKALANHMSVSNMVHTKFHGVTIRRILGENTRDKKFMLQSNSMAKLKIALKKAGIEDDDEESRAKTLASRDYIKIWYSIGKCYRSITQKKSLFSEKALVLPDGLLEKVFSVVDRAFCPNSPQFGFGQNALHMMFYGPCRTGKTSIAFAIAAKYNLDITCMSADTFGGSDQTPVVPYEGDLFVIDEFDVFLEALDDKSTTTVAGKNHVGSKSLVVFQQLIENAFKVPRSILIYTTNNIEKIDKRFLKRCALVQEVTYFDKAQASRFLDKLGLPGSDHYIENGDAQQYMEYARAELEKQKREMAARDLSSIEHSMSSTKAQLAQAVAKIKEVSFDVESSASRTSFLATMAEIADYSKTIDKCAEILDGLAGKKRKREECDTPETDDPKRPKTE